jgi:hypothetical protein
LSTELREGLQPLLREVESLNERINEYDRRIEKIAKETYPETELLSLSRYRRSDSSEGGFGFLKRARSQFPPM